MKIHGMYRFNKLELGIFKILGSAVAVSVSVAMLFNPSVVIAHSLDSCTDPHLVGGLTSIPCDLGGGNYSAVGVTDYYNTNAGFNSIANVNGIGPQIHLFGNSAYRVQGASSRMALIDSVGSKDQSKGKSRLVGQQGLTMFITSHDPKVPITCPSDSVIAGSTDSRMVQSVEGGTGFWGDVKYDPSTPRFRINFTTSCYNNQGWQGYIGYTSKGQKKETRSYPLHSVFVITASNLLVPLEAFTFNKSSGVLPTDVWQAWINRDGLWPERFPSNEIINANDASSKVLSLYLGVKNWPIESKPGDPVADMNNPLVGFIIPGFWDGLKRSYPSGGYDKWDGYYNLKSGELLNADFDYEIQYRQASLDVDHKTGMIKTASLPPWSSVFGYADSADLPKELTSGGSNGLIPMQSAQLVYDENEAQYNVLSANNNSLDCDKRVTPGWSWASYHLLYNNTFDPDVPDYWWEYNLPPVNILNQKGPGGCKTALKVKNDDGTINYPAMSYSLSSDYSKYGSKCSKNGAYPFQVDGKNKYIDHCIKINNAKANNSSGDKTSWKKFVEDDAPMVVDADDFIKNKKADKKVCYKTGDIGNGSILVYYWSKFEDQPAMQYAKNNFYNKKIESSGLKWGEEIAELKSNVGVYNNSAFLRVDQESYGNASINNNLIVSPTSNDGCRSDGNNCQGYVPVVVAQCKPSEVGIKGACIGKVKLASGGDIDANDYITQNICKEMR